MATALKNGADLETVLQSYDELRLVTEQLRSDIATAQPEQIGGLIAKRASLIAGLPIPAGDIGDSQRALLRAKLDELLLLDASNQESLRSRLAEIAAERLSTNNARCAFRRYAYLQPVTSSAFIDRRE